MSATPAAKRLLLTRSSHDICNHYLYAYSEGIVSFAEANGWRVEKAENGENNAATVRSRLKNKPCLVLFNGHGSDNEVCGHKNQVIFCSKDACLLENAIAYIRSCSSLTGLGKAAVENGAKAVVGYRGVFWIPRVNEYNSRPLQDPAAKPVLETSNVLPFKLLKGSTVAEAVKASQDKAYDFIFRMLASDEPYDSAALQALVTNSQNLGFEGNGNARA